MVIADTAIPGGHETVRMIKESGGEATFTKTDVRISAEVESTVLETVKIYGSLDCAFSNAGIAGWLGRRPVNITGEMEGWDDVVNTNTKGGMAMHEI